MCFLNESYFVLLAVKDDKDLITAQSLMGKKFDGSLGHILTAFNFVCLGACVLKQVPITLSPLSKSISAESSQRPGSEPHAMASRRQEHIAHRCCSGQREGQRLIGPVPSPLSFFLFHPMHAESCMGCTLCLQILRGAAAAHAATQITVIFFPQTTTTDCFQYSAFTRIRIIKEQRIGGLRCHFVRSAKPENWGQRRQLERKMLQRLELHLQMAFCIGLQQDQRRVVE